jgi:transmembrane sensor
MRLSPRILSSFRARVGPPPPEEPASSRIDSMLARRIASVRDADPETAGMWRSLNAELEKGAPSVNLLLRPLSARLVKAAIAAAVVVCLILAGELWTRHPTGSTYATSRGEQATVDLPDSSLVTLNHTTSLTVEPATGEKTRRVTLKGEAFFRIRRNGTPFVVSTPLGSVTVLGTEFNVLAREDRLEVAVLSGSVRLSVPGHGRDSSVVLTSGQIATCRRGGFPGTPGVIPFTVYPGWMHGRFLFYRTSLRDACREIESQFAVAVRIADPRVEEETITGAVDNTSAERAVSVLSQLAGNRYRYEDGTYTLY